MRTTLLLALLAIHYANTEPVTSRSKQKAPSGGKRELEEGNVFGKRAPVLATASPSLSPGIEYADTKDQALDKLPIQQYEGVPQIGKISDVLTGQGPFQAAIAGHLYSPVSVYQQRPSQAYEVGPPVPSQLAYSEHRLSIPNFNQYNLPQKQQIQQQIPIFNKQIPNFDQPQYQQFQQIQQLLQQIPNNHFLQPLQYNPQPSLQQAPQPSLQPSFQFQPQQFQQIPSQPNIVFNQNQQQEQNYQINQRDLKSQPIPSQILQKQNNIQDYNQKQNALSYATFIYNPVDAIQQQQLRIQPQLQHQQQIQHQPRPQIQYQLEHPLLGNYNPPIQHAQYQPQTQRFAVQPQLQNQQFNQLQLQPQQYDAPAHTKTYQREASKQEEYPNILTPLPAPTFPPVQYFGKFAPSILNYQH